MELSHHFSSQKSQKIAAAALASTIFILGSVGSAQIVKNEAEDAVNDHTAPQENTDPQAKSEKSVDNLEGMKFEELIKLLGHDDFKVRKKVHLFVWKQGKAIIPTLEQAVTSDDPEINVRASDILRNLRIGVTHDTPKHIAEKVAEFQYANIDEKDDILRFLFNSGAYSHMVFLLAEMENREDANTLHSNFKELAHLAAKSALVKDDVKAAIELLKMSPQSKRVRRSLAFIYAKTGIAREQYEILKERAARSKSDDEFIIMLLQEMNERELLRDFASESKFTYSTKVLDLLNADPRLFIEKMKRKPTVTQAMGLDLIKEMYEGEPSDLYANTYKLLADDGKKQQRLKKFMPMNVLFLTGGSALGEKILLDNAPNKAFNYYDNGERPAEALAAIGLSDKASIIKWRDPLIKATLNPKPRAQNNLRRELNIDYISEDALLLQVASFYHRRGQKENAKLIVEPLLDTLHAQDRDRWSDLIADFTRFNMHELAIENILKLAGDNDLMQMIDLLYDGSDSVHLIWRELLKRELSAKESFQDLAKLTGMIRASHDVKVEVENQLIKLAKKEGVQDTERMVEALYNIADFRCDSIQADLYLDKVMKLEKNDNRRRHFIQDAFSMAALNLDWKKLLDLFEKNPEFGVESPEWMTVKSIATRELGDEAQADLLLERAMLLTTGQTNEMLNIFNELLWAGDMKRATDLLERDLLVYSDDTETYEFIRALGFLADTNSYYLLSAQWNKAAAMAYASNSVTMTFMQDNLSESPYLNEMMRMNFILNFARGMQFYEEGDHQKAKISLGKANQSIVGDGVLADIFYPAVKNTPYKKEYQKWVIDSYNQLKIAITDFPDTPNTLNTLAWILSRSCVKVDEGIKFSTKALELSEDEPAYLDTMAELFFAKGDRKKAIEWGNRAVKSSKSGSLIGRAGKRGTKARTLSLYTQLKRFKTADLPK